MPVPFLRRYGSSKSSAQSRFIGSQTASTIPNCKVFHSVDSVFRFFTNHLRSHQRSKSPAGPEHETVLIPELQVSCISKIWRKDIPEEFTKIPVLDEFVRTQSSTDNRLAFYRAALHLQVHYSGSRDRTALRQRSAQVILEQTRAIVADLFPLLSSLNTNSEDLGYLGLAHRDGAKDSSIRHDDLPDPQIVLRKRILQTMADTKPLLTTLETLLHRIEEVARWNTDHLWELSVDTR
jgi:hypothetical protein